MANTWTYSYLQIAGVCGENKIAWSTDTGKPTILLAVTQESSYFKNIRCMSKLLKIRDDSTNYTTTVIKLPVMQPIQGLDNLVQVNVFGNNCLISKNSDPNVLYLFIPAGSQLSEKFLSANNLYRDIALNYNQNCKGFFEPNGRVKGLKIKGIVSNGFVIPATSLQIMYPYSEGGDMSDLEIGDEFNEWHGIEVCRKYIPAGTRTPGVKGDKQSRVNNKLSHLLIPTQFRFHGETTHLSKNLHNINPNDIVVITDKWHGSSCILSNVCVNRRLTFVQKLWNKVNWLPKFDSRKLAYIASSGKPKSNLPKLIQGEWLNNGPDFYSSNIWKDALEKYKPAIESGISLYGEIVGFESGGGFIQKNYDYKCEPGTNRFVVYKITYTKPDGDFIVFSWQQLKDYCNKYSLEHVKELFHGKVKPMGEQWDEPLPLEPSAEQLENWRSHLFYNLQNGFNLEDYCKQCNNKVPAEGIVIWKDGALNRYEVYKLKSQLFTLKESNEDETNIEEQQ